MADECQIEEKFEEINEESEELVSKAKGGMYCDIEKRNSINPAISFDDFIFKLVANPKSVLRNIFQIFHDMIKHYVGEGVDEYPDDPESIKYVRYDCSKLFVEGTDSPFFADRLFANRLIRKVEALKKGVQQNKIYIFKGPPGCGKSTFLNNMLFKFELFANSDLGQRDEIVWRLDRKDLGGLAKRGNPMLNKLVEQLSALVEQSEYKKELALDEEKKEKVEFDDCRLQDDFDPEDPDLNGDPCIDVPCPNHDSPILMIPKHYRREFFDDLFENNKFKFELSTEKEYEWVFRDEPCTICSSLYEALLNKLKDPEKVFGMIYARPYRFNRRLGNGITIFNPGDQPLKQSSMTNKLLQQRVNRLLKDSNLVQYTFSQFAKTNKGVYALMDVKSHNTERLIELHNIVSEGVHKVEDLEENVNSLLLAVMNPEDEKNIQGFQSFLDRVEYIKIPYVMEIFTEVEIYRNVFGRHIDDIFLPMVLYNFARAMIASRLSKKSEAIFNWLTDEIEEKDEKKAEEEKKKLFEKKKEEYKPFCDEDFLLLKMEIYSGYIPEWLSEKDRKALTAEHRRNIIDESENEGDKGISERETIDAFERFLSLYSKEGRLLNMSHLDKFLKYKLGKNKRDRIPQKFFASMIKMYNYTILQEVKESLYYYNEEQIDREIKNYLFAINHDVGDTEVCNYTGEKLEITDDFLEKIEKKLLGLGADKKQRTKFRADKLKTYTSTTLVSEMQVKDLPIEKTKIYKELRGRYVHHLKKDVLKPFEKNENFRRAIKEFGTDDFKTYDKKIKDKINYLFKNLQEKYKYTKQGAQEVCIYVIDEDLPKNFKDK